MSQPNVFWPVDVWLITQNLPANVVSPVNGAANQIS